jgi:hypothetical protein
MRACSIPTRVRAPGAALALLLAAGCGEISAEPQSSAVTPPANADEVGADDALINPNNVLVAEQEVATLALGQSTGRRLTIEIRHCKNGAPQQHNHIICQPGNGFVAVGGGAWAEAVSFGGFLTASYPRDASFTAWVGRSKDHVIGEAHTLHVFVIGLKAGDLTPPELRNHLSFTTAVSGVSTTPTAVAVLPQGYRLISGGAESLATGAGQLLTGSSAGCAVAADGKAIDDNCRVWVASAKAHFFSNAAAVKAYAVGIRTLPAGLGELDIRYRASQVSGGGGLHAIDKVVSSDFVVSGIGGATFWNGAGRMLSRLSPAGGDFVNDRVSIWSKDHLQADGGSTIGLLVEISTRPPF